MSQKIWILAESDRLFLPKLLARLAAESKIEGIIEIRFNSSMRKRISGFNKLLETFGLLTCFLIFLSTIISIILDKSFSNKFYSLSKVSRVFQIPLYNCVDFNDPKLIELLENKIKASPVLVQVGKRVPKHLTDRYYLINKHCSLLPDYAGVFPVFWCMLNKESNQGVSIHRLNEKFDDGEILAYSQIANEGSFFSIYHRLYDLSANLILEVLNKGEAKSEKAVSGANKSYRYFSYPTAKDRKAFFQKGNRFGWPLNTQKH